MAVEDDRAASTVTSARIEVTLQIGLDSEGRPVGDVRSGRQPASEFVGWLALMAELARFLPDQAALPGPDEEP